MKIGKQVGPKLRYDGAKLYLMPCSAVRTGERVRNLMDLQASTMKQID
jgi:hypothetical protein